MKVGITYDLRSDYLAMGYSETETAEFDRPDTIDAIEEAIRACGHETDRIGHLRSLVGRLAAGDRWDLVFNIAEGMYGFAREAQIPALLDAWQINYTFSDALVLALALHKGMAKRVMRDLGIPTPDFAVVESHEDIAAVKLPFPLFAKPVAEGTGKGVSAHSKLTTREELDRVCRALLREHRQPVLIEEFLPGREFTVGIVGTGRRARALGTLEVVLRGHAEEGVYSYVNKEQCEDLVQYVLTNDAASKDAEALAVEAWRGLGCRDAGRVDLRAGADGRLSVLEVNPLAGLHPLHSDLPILCTAIGMSFHELIRQILEEASLRDAGNGAR